MFRTSLAATLILASAAHPQRGRPADTVRVTQVTTIGEDSPGTPVVFGEISGFAFDARDRLYVSDFKERRVVVLDGGGKQLATIGRGGKGPGEFEAPTGPAIGADGSLYVRNMSSLSRFDLDPATSLPTKYAAAFQVFGFAPWRSKFASAVNSAGVFAFPRDSIPSATRINHRSYVRYTRDGKVVDTIRVPSYATDAPDYASFQVSANTGRMLRGLATAPFEPRPVWTVTRQGTILSGDGRTYDLVESDGKGREIRHFTRALPASAVPAKERAESLAVLKARRDSIPVPLDQVNGMSDAVRRLQLPSLLPPYIGVESAADGRVWVRRWPPAANTTVYDIFAATGAFEGTIVLPRTCNGEPRPVMTATRFACLVIDPDTGAETIMLAALPSGARALKP